MGKEFIIREYSYSVVNANRVWPGTQLLAQYISDNGESILRDNASWLELGAATGALALWISYWNTKGEGFHGTTTDFDDGETNEIGSSIADNFRRNDQAVIPHIRHSWGTPIGDKVGELGSGSHDIIFASDILIYESQYSLLVETLLALFRKGSKSFVMCWNRPKVKGCSKFFDRMNEAGFITTQPSKYIWIFTR